MKIKKITSLILVAITLAVMLTSCDNGENRLSNSGEIGADAVRYMSTGAWNVDARRREDGNSTKRNTYDELKEALANGDRFSDFSLSIKDTKELRGKKLEKTTFTIEADRKVTLTICWHCYDLDSIQKIYRKTITLEPNKPQNIELNFTDEFKINRESVVGVVFWQNDNEAKPKSYGTDAFAEWNQTIYKITDFKIFCN